GQSVDVPAALGPPGHQRQGARVLLTQVDLLTTAPSLNSARDAGRGKAIGSSMSQSYRQSARFQRTRSSVRRRKGRHSLTKLVGEELKSRLFRIPDVEVVRPSRGLVQCVELEVKAWHAFERR